MDTIVKFASQISTPLILAGIVVGVLWGLFKLVVEKSPEWAKKDSVVIIVKIINWVGVLALVSIILGFAGFVAPKFDNFTHTEKQKTENQNHNVSDESIRSNIMALLHGGNVTEAMAQVERLESLYAKQEETKHIHDYCAKNSVLNEKVKNACSSL